MKKKRLFSLSFLLVFLLSCIQTTAYGVTTSKSIDKVTRTSPTESITVGEEYTITHTLEGTPQEIQEVSKEIVLVLDVSGSMDTKDMEKEEEDIENNKENKKGERDKKRKYNGDDTTNKQTRLAAMQDAATNFIDQFAGQDVKIALVPYATSADGPTDYYYMSDETQVEDIKDEIEVLYADQGTNIGDGIRRGYYKLINSGNDKAAKYMVVMTDGMPQGYTIGYNDIEWDWYKYWYNYWYWVWKETPIYKGTYFYDDDGDTGVSRHSEVNEGEDFFYKNGKEEENKGIAVLAEYEGGGSNSISYAQEMASKVSYSNNIQSFFIGFSSDADLDILNNIATSAIADKVEGERRYYDAKDKNELNSVFTDIQGKIEDTLPFKEVTYTETIPEGVEVVSLPDGFKQEGNKITGKISAKMVKNKEINQYELEAEPFDITVKMETPGEYVFNSATLSYTDPFDNSDTAPVDSITINVEGNLTLNKNTIYLKKGDMTNLEASVIPEDYAHDLIWTIVEGEDIFNFTQKEISTKAGTNKISITGKNVEKGKIQVAYKKGGELDPYFTASCYVYVYDIGDENEINLLKDKSKPITSISVPEGIEVEYTSNNGSVAIVDSSKVTGKDVGSTKVVATLYIDTTEAGKPVKKAIDSKEYTVNVYNVEFIKNPNNYGNIYSSKALLKLKFKVETPKDKQLPQPTTLNIKADFTDVDNKLGYENGGNLDITFMDDNDIEVLDKSIKSNDNIEIVFGDITSGTYELLITVDIKADDDLTLEDYKGYEGKKIKLTNILSTLGYDVPFGEDENGTVSVLVALDPSIR